MIFIYPNTLSTFHGDRDIALSAGYVEIADDIYADLVEGKKKWSNNKIVTNPDYAEQVAENNRLSEIATLKGQLAATDYQAIKFAEGWLSTDEYAEMKAQRQAWRDRINELESL